MSAWRARWGQARLDHCEAGHDAHRHVAIPVRLTPGHRPVDDGPSSPLPVRFNLFVFDAAHYANQARYCVGDDELSRAVIEQGCWEPWATAVAVAVLASSEPGSVIDLGCHVGWYTMLAMRFGHHAYALDADPEHVELLARNAAGAGLDPLLHAAVGWLDAESWPITPAEVGPVRLAKVDLEGAEGLAADVLAPLLAERALDYALVELSPEFGDGWRHALDVFALADYRAHLLPDKGDDLDAFEADPLGVTLARPGPPADLAAQATVLLAAP